MAARGRVLYDTEHAFAREQFQKLEMAEKRDVKYLGEMLLWVG